MNYKRLGMQTCSDWQKIDLHIHTDESKKTKPNDYRGIFSVNTLKRKLIENEVAIFSLTDHNIINTAAYIEYLQNFQQSDPFPLLGVELDVEHTNGNVYHALVIFKEDITKNEDFVGQISAKLENLYQNQSPQQRKTTFKDIIETFHMYEFMFILHGEGDRSIWEAIKNKSKTDIGDVSNFIIVCENLGLEKVKEETIKNWNTGFDKITSEGLSSEDYIPYMTFSDNHNIEQYPCTHMDKALHSFTYIKGLPNYESLRLAFIDPLVRIKNEDNVKKIKNEVSLRGYIDKIDIRNVKLKDNAQTKIEKAELVFSPYLNAIIGGRSTGKSLLIEILKQKIAGLQSYQDNKEKYSFETKDTKIKTDQDQEWAEVANISSDKIAYLSQGRIVEYFQNGNMKDFATQVGKNQEYNDVLAAFKTKKSEILDIETDLIKKYNEITTEKTNISACKIQQTDIDYMTGDSWSFKNYEQSVSSINNESKKENIGLLKQELEKFKLFWNLAQQELDVFNSFISLLDSKHKILELQEKILELKQTFAKEADSIIKKANEQASSTGLSKDASQKKLASDRINNIPNIAYGIFTKFLELNQTLKQISKISLYYEKSIEIDDNICIGFSTNDNNERKLDDLIKTSVFSGIEPTSTTYQIVCHDHSINQTGTRGNNINFENKLKNVIQLDSFDNPISFLVYKNLNNSKSSNNSPGLNCEYYLKTIFANRDITTIIIDQPEDNLGTTFISEKCGLVDTIRQAKLDKQIFLATHNASIVVYGDAENIILAENKENHIIYTPILMENGEEAMKTICENLDGGKKVFENRSRKYNIKKIKEVK